MCAHTISCLVYVRSSYVTSWFLSFVSFSDISHHALVDGMMKALYKVDVFLKKIYTRYSLLTSALFGVVIQRDITPRVE